MYFEPAVIHYNIQHNINYNLQLPLPIILPGLEAISAAGTILFDFLNFGLGVDRFSTFLLVSLGLFLREVALDKGLLGLILLPST